MRLLLFNLATDADDPVLGFTTRWINALARRIESVDVLTMRAGRLDVAPNVRVHSVGKDKGWSEPRRALAFYGLLFRILRRTRPHACFSHMMPLFTVMAGPVLRARRIPTVTWYAHPRLSATLKLAHFFSERMVTSLPTAYPYKRDKLEVIGQGIDTELFAPDGTPPEQPPMILCPGRLSPVKNLETLLRATLLLRQMHRGPFRVVLLGGPATPADESYARALRAFVAQNHLEDIVRFELPRPITDLPAWYRRATLCVNLTPTGSGDKTVLEAMACARPCLVANQDFCSFMGELAPSLLFHAGDEHDLCRKLADYLAWDAEKCRQGGAFLRQRIAMSHSLEHLVSQLVSLVEHPAMREPVRGPRDGSDGIKRALAEPEDRSA